MKQKNIETLLYSTIGVVALFIVILAFNLIAGAFKQRLDLTAEKAYTLSAGTKKILSRLDTPVTIRYYFSKSGNNMPPQLKTYGQRVEDLLAEYKQAAKGKIVIEKHDPQPDSDDEDSAHINGIEGQTYAIGVDRIYLGIAVSQLDEKVALPFLSPDRERLLEYDISRAISRVINPTPPVIGVMTALPMFGQPVDPMTRRMGRQQGEEPWVVISELKKDFTIKEIPMTATKIDDEIKVLAVIHPKDITEATQYAIDQFIMRGGRLLAFLDPHAYFDQKHDQMAQVMGESSGQSTLDKLLKAWGLEMDMNKVVADMDFANHQPNGTVMPSVLMLSRKAIKEDDVVTGQIDNMVLPFAGAFTGKPADGLKEDVLLKASANSQLIEGMLSAIGSEQIVKDFKAANVNYALAVRLTGKFKTAFPNGKPKEKDKDSKDGKDEPKTDVADPNQLKETKGDSAVILIADTDMVSDQACVQVQNVLGYKIVQPVNGNLNFVQSCIEQLSGDSDLISLRSRGTLNRPFTRLKEMEAAAGRQWEDKAKELEAKKAETERKISELQQHKEGSQQKFILSPEQQKELENYKQTQVKFNKDLKDVRKQLRQDTDALQFKTKVLNIAGVPALVALTGIVLAFIKRKKTAAK